MKMLKRVQNLPIALDEAWDFFSSPGNLKKITPTFMGFNVTSGNQKEKMYQGMIITYKVSPFLGIPLDWVTEITHVSEPYFFVDNQKAGPFKYWHHQHIFKEIDSGVEMTDIVNYAVPVPLIGMLMEYLLVESRVIEIFDFRFKKLHEIFGTY